MDTEVKPAQNFEADYKYLKNEMPLVAAWFEHIEQMAHDKKTANGIEMDEFQALTEIKTLAHACVDYVKNFLV